VTTLEAAERTPSVVGGEPRATSSTAVYAALAVIVVAAAVLRFWRLGGTTLIWDETFTGVAARLPFGGLVSFLRAHDVHPPLDYLVRGPIARHTTSEWLFRLPSAVASVAAVALMAWWLRRRGLFGVVATALFAVGAFELTYAWQARFYALMMLMGVATAMLAHRWLRDGGWRLALLCGAVALVGALQSESGLVLAFALMLLPGLRRDRDAWWWRGSLAAAGVIWLALWGPVVVHQFANVSESPASYTSVHSVLSTINELVDSAPALIPLTAILLVAGGLCLAREDRAMARVVVFGFVVPVGIMALLGFSTRVVWPKQVAYTAWAPMVTLAAVVDVAVKRWRLLGVGVGVLVAVVVLPSTAHTLAHPQIAPPSWGAEVRALQHEVRPGDAVAAPSSLVQPIRWYLGGAAEQADPPSRLPIDPYLFFPKPGSVTDRVWAVDTGSLLPSIGLRPCGPVRRYPDGVRVQCFERQP
jgi:hypothetical protein